LLRRTFSIRKETRHMPNSCPFCKNPLTPWYQWKAIDDRLYCNEFCADAGETGIEFTPPAADFLNQPSPRA
jgi:hypothetical protein